MTGDVIFSPEAREDILQLYNYIAAQTGAARALDFTERIVAYCQGFAMFPERGTKRDDLRAGLRIVGYGRRVTIAFHVTHDSATIDRILYGGRDLPTALNRGRR